MTTIVNMSRRDVVKGVAGMTGLVLGFHVDGWRGIPFAKAATTTNFAPNVYLAMDETGLVTIVAHRSEMGTGIRTGLPMVLADELEADWTRVVVVQAQGDVKYGDQNTDGSRSTRQFYQPMRIAGASARQMLEDAAAHVWGVDAKDCRASNHMVVHAPTGRQLPFGDLAKVAASLPVPPSDHMELRFGVEVATRVGKSVLTVRRWRRRYAAKGVDGLLKDATRPPGRSPLTARKIKQVVNLTLNEKPPDATHWSERRMAARAGIAPSSVHKIRAAHGLKPHLTKTFKLSRHRRQGRRYRRPLARSARQGPGAGGRRKEPNPGP